MIDYERVKNSWGKNKNSKRMYVQKTCFLCMSMGGKYAKQIDQLLSTKFTYKLLLLNGKEVKRA